MPALHAYASLRARMVASIIDLLFAGVIVQPVVFLILLSIAWVEGRYFPESHEYLQEISGTDWFGMSLKYCGGLVFPLLWVWRMKSPGKKMRRLRIVSARDGGRLAFWQAWMRYTVYFVIVMSGYYYWWDYSTTEAVMGTKPHMEYPIAAAFLLPLLPVFFTPKRQGLHDLIAGTVVVYVREKEAAHNQPPKTAAARHRRLAKEMLAFVGYYWFVVILIIIVNTPFIRSA